MRPTQIDTKEKLLEHFGMPMGITDATAQDIAKSYELGVIRLDDGERIEVPEYDRNDVRTRYFSEVGDPTLTDEMILHWLDSTSNERQVVDPDHLPYDPKCGF